MTLTEYLQRYLDNRKNVYALRMSAGKAAEMLGPEGWKPVGDGVLSSATVTNLTQKLAVGHELVPGMAVPFQWSEKTWSLSSEIDPPSLEIKLLDVIFDQQLDLQRSIQSAIAQAEVGDLEAEPVAAPVSQLNAEIAEAGTEVARLRRPESLAEPSETPISASPTTEKPPRVRRRVAKLGLVGRAEPEPSEVPSETEQTASNIEPITQGRLNLTPNRPKVRVPRSMLAEQGQAPSERPVPAVAGHDLPQPETTTAEALELNLGAPEVHSQVEAAQPEAISELLLLLGVDSPASDPTPAEAEVEAEPVPTPPLLELAPDQGIALEDVAEAVAESEPEPIAMPLIELAPDQGIAPEDGPEAVAETEPEPIAVPLIEPAPDQGIASEDGPEAVAESEPEPIAIPLIELSPDQGIAPEDVAEAVAGRLAHVTGRAIAEDKTPPKVTSKLARPTGPPVQVKPPTQVKPPEPASAAEMVPDSPPVSAPATVPDHPQDQEAEADCSFAQLIPSLLQGRPGRKLTFVPGTFPVLYLNNFPISVGLKLIGSDPSDRLEGMVPETDSFTPGFSHWQQNEQGLKSDSPFLPDCLHFVAGAPADLELLAERPGEAVVRSGGVLRYLGVSAVPVDLCKNDERGLLIPQVVLRDKAVWVLAWLSKAKGWLRILGPTQEFQLIRYGAQGDTWSASRFGTFPTAPVWSVSPGGGMCGWVRSTKSDYIVEIVDCVNECIIGELPLPARLGTPTRLLVSDKGNFAIQGETIAVIGERVKGEYRTIQIPLEEGMQCASLGAFGLLCRRDDRFQHCPLPSDSWACQTLTLDKVGELARAYPLVHVHRNGPVLVYTDNWLALPFHCADADAWPALLESFRRRHFIKESVELIDFQGHKRFVQLLQDSIQLSQFRVFPIHGQWEIAQANPFRPVARG